MTAKKKAKPTFEEGMDALDALTQKLSEGGLTLEDAIKTYEQGMQLAVQLEEMLAAQKKRIEQIDPETAEIAPLEEE